MENKYDGRKLDEALNVFESGSTLEFGQRIAKLYDAIYNGYPRFEDIKPLELETELPKIKAAIKTALEMEYVRLLIVGDRDGSRIIYKSKVSNETDFLDKEKYPLMINLLNEVEVIWFNLIDTPAKKNDGGCFIATMAYGNYNHPQVMILREFRDNVLNKSFLGKRFIKTYYHYSPKLVEKLKDNKDMNTTIRRILNQFIKIIA